jgi:DNA-directed RNA polymerase subunit RPC12/RpoP
MAVKNVCPNCKKSFSAPESYLGKKVECPTCGHKSVLRSADELEELENMQAARQRQREEDQRRVELIERMETRREASRPYYETYGTGQKAVRHFNPNAPSRFLRFRALSEVLLIFAYVELLLVFLGIGVTIFLKVTGVITTIPVLLLCLVGWSVFGTVLYLGLKFAGEFAFLLSDIGDLQKDLVQILLDISENTETSPESEL